MIRIQREAVLPILAAALAAFSPDAARAQCDPAAEWTVFQPTGEISEIVMQGSRAWIAANGGVIRADLGSGVEQQIKMGVRVEQQALAKHGLNYVIDEYLPRKMSNTKAFLP